jgi:hypothetical protein
MQFSPVSCSLLPLSITYFPQHHSGTPPVCAPPLNVTDQVSNPNKTTGRIIVMYIRSWIVNVQIFLPKSQQTFLEFKLLPLSLWQHYWYVSTLPQYLYFKTFSNDPLCPVFYLLNKTIQLVPLVVTSGQNSLLVCNETPVFSLVLG